MRGEFCPPGVRRRGDAVSDGGLVQKTVRVARTVAANPDGIGLSELARSTGIPKATCHRIVTALVAEDWVVFDDTSKRFRMSLSVLLMLSTVSDRDTALSYVRQRLAALAAEVTETTGLDQRAGGTAVMVLAQAIGPHNVSLGQRAVPRLQPAWCTSTGKIFLAENHPDTVREALRRDEQFRSSKRYPDIESLMAELQQTRERGFASTRDELEVGAASVACPVRVNGVVSFAIWVGGPSYRLPPDRVPELAESTQRAANDVERILARTPMGLGDVMSASLPSKPF